MSESFAVSRLNNVFVSWMSGQSDKLSLLIEFALIAQAITTNACPFVGRRRFFVVDVVGLTGISFTLPR